MESWRSSPDPTNDSANACSHPGDNVMRGMKPCSLVFMSLIWRDSRARTCSVINITLRVCPHASEMPSKIVAKSRTDTRSARRFCNAR